MLHFIDFIAHRPIFHKIADSLLCSFHNIFKFRLFVHRQSQAGQRNKQVACTTLEPGVACKYIMLLSLFVMELVGRIFQTVVEAIPRSTVFRFRLKGLLQLRGEISEIPAENTMLSPFLCPPQNSRAHTGLH